MRTIVAGSRDFSDYKLLKGILLCYPDITTIVSGRARGADSLGERFALEQGIPIDLYPADWKKYGKSAGYRRNIEMAKNADRLVAFWDGESRGTKHMIDISEKEELEVYIINYGK